MARVQAALSLEGATRDVRVEGILITVDRQGIEVEDVRVDPPTVLVNVPVNRITSRKRVPVVPRIEGTVAPSFFIARIGVVPTSVEIEGEPGALERVDAVETLPIDIADARGDIEREVGFEAIEGIMIRSDQPFAQVAVVVEPLDETTTIQVAVVLTNLGSGLQAIADQPFLQIIMSGPAEVLQGLRGGDILAEVDLSNRAPGLHQIQPVIAHPSPDTPAHHASHTGSRGRAHRAA